MATGDRKDPVMGFNFTVEIGSMTVGGFNEVSGLQCEIEVQEYREGGLNEYVHKRAGPAKYSSTLTLKRGIVDAGELWSWYRKVMQGKMERKTVSVLLMDSAGQEKQRWVFQNAYPVKWVGPNLRATASEVAVETMELAHEGFAP